MANVSVTQQRNGMELSSFDNDQRIKQSISENNLSFGFYDYRSKSKQNV